MTCRDGSVLHAVEAALHALESCALDDSTARRTALDALRSGLGEDSTIIDSNRSKLTEREYEIHRLVVAGRTNPQIATTLFISVNTVRFHVSNILTKLGLGSRSELIIADMRASRNIMRDSRR